MTPDRPSPEAMEEAERALDNCEGGTQWECPSDAREGYVLNIATSLDRFARARVEEEREAFVIVLDALEINLRSNPVTKTAWLECDQTNTSDEEAVAAYRAISARRGRG